MSHPASSASNSRNDALASSLAERFLGPSSSSTHHRTKRSRGEEETLPTIPSSTERDIPRSEASDLSPAASGASRREPRTRADTACQLCRSRKTKCDNKKPACGYCTKVGAASCTYAELDYVSGTKEFHNQGSQLLNAIGKLTNLIEEERFRHRNGESELYVQSAPNPGPAEKIDYPEPMRIVWSSGLESVLKWEIFPSHLRLISEEDDGVLPQSHSLPNIEYHELIRLEAKYIATVHNKNPILDLQVLRHLTSHLAENGLDWSVNTCLVALVCAIGALSQRYTAIGETPRSIVASDGSMTYYGSDEEPEVAMRFWSVAAKRLGFIIGQNSLEAVQCLCLTGIWYMQNLQALQAWKFFNMAGNAWFAATRARRNSGVDGEDNRERHSLSLEQSLFFTSYKSECELRFELAIPSSVLDHFEYGYTFPIPPNLDARRSELPPEESEDVVWYYYLAEIASRHLMYRLVQARSRPLSAVPTAHEIQRLLDELEMFEMQLHDWHKSLPEVITFAIPDGELSPLDNEVCQILRIRYLGFRELCYRPFVELCLNHTLNFNPDLVAKVSTAASRGLLCCMYRLQSLSTKQPRHHGLWFILRNSTTASIILVAAKLAQRNPRLNAAAGLLVPSGVWEELVRVQERMAPFLYEGRGEVVRCAQLVQWALGAYQ